ncbi:MAG: arginase family protein [Candidatus Krumholzibacteriota bacterium]|nr:arginase family protein [Candidatus Krumholzibacteriota bacterium]
MRKCYDFLGAEAVGKNGGRVAIVPVPLESSTSYIQGTAGAPQAILDASAQIEYYHPALDLDLENSGIFTIRSDIRDRDTFGAFLGEYRKQYADVFTCFIGGEHSITPWILEGMGYGDIGIVWLDAHADLRREYQGKRESHACAARNSLPFGDIVEVGVRSFSRREKEFIQGTDRVRVFHRWEEGARQALLSLPRRVYLSLDFDALDPALLRAVGTPQPDGLTWRELMEILTFIFDRKEVVGMDAVEFCPQPHDHASDFIAAKIIYEAVARYLAREV